MEESGICVGFFLACVLSFWFDVGFGDFSLLKHDFIMSFSQTGIQVTIFLPQASKCGNTGLFISSLSLSVCV